MVQYRPGPRYKAHPRAKVELGRGCGGNFGAAKRAGDAAGAVDLEEALYASLAEDMLARELERGDFIRAVIGKEVVKGVGRVA